MQDFMLWCLWGKAEINHVIDRVVFEVGYRGQIIPDPDNIIVKQTDIFNPVEGAITECSGQDDPF